MKRANQFVIGSNWKLILRDMQVDPAAVLAHAGLPADLSQCGDMALSPPDYFRLWHGMETSAGKRELPLVLADHDLKQSKLSLGEISFLLGFQEPNSFIRAYQGWTGMSPGSSRAQGH